MKPAMIATEAIIRQKAIGQALENLPQGLADRRPTSGRLRVIRERQ
jgi:hypothetical protein